MTLPAFIARIPGLVSLDGSPLIRSGRLSIVASGDPKEMRIMRVGITCAELSIVTDLAYDLVRRNVDLVRSGTRVASAKSDVSLSGILSPQGGFILLTRDPGEIAVDAISDPIRVSIAVSGSRSSRILVWFRDLVPTIRMLSSLPSPLPSPGNVKGRSP